MKKYIIRNYREPIRIPRSVKDGDPVTLNQDGVLETDDPQLASAVSSMPNLNVTTRTGAKPITPEKPIPTLEVEGQAGEGVEGVEDFESMSVKDLKKLAVKRGIDLPTRILKADIIQLLLEQN